MKDLYIKRIVLLLRWTSIIVISYLIIFSNGRISNQYLGYLFILGYIVSNIILTFFPRGWFSNPRFFYSLLLIDTGLLSFGMYLSEAITTDFYVIFFLVIIFASISRNFKLLVAVAATTSLIYGFLLYAWGLLTSEESISYTLRIPFIFIIAVFYGYIIHSFTKEAKEQLALSEDRYRGLFENANDGIIILKGPKFKIEDLNKKVEHLIGYKREEILGMEFINLFWKEDRERGEVFLDEVMNKGESRTDSLSLLKLNGMPLEVDLSINRIDLGDESFYQAIFRDLTEQKKLEKNIRDSKMNLEAIFNGIRDQITIISPDYKILRVNKASVDFHKKDYQDLIGENCYTIYYGRTSPCDDCPASLTIEKKQPNSSTITLSEGETILKVFSYPILDERGNLNSVIEYVRDITEEQRLQEQLIQSEKLAGIGIMASGVAHEINNPLSGIIGMAEIALSENGDIKTKSYLMDILQCGQRINEIVKGLRSYYKTAKKEENALIDINEVLRDSLKMVRLATKTGEVEIEEQLQPLERIEANVGEIQHVFTNLITNAFQAMNGKKGRLSISTRMLKDAIEVKVSDNGIGIPQKYLHHIFDPFFTTKKPGEGKGLGLNIVYRIVTRYEGKIDVESKEGIGTTFRVRFPIRRISNEEEGINRR